MEKTKNRIIVLLVINITNLIFYLSYIINRLSGFNLIRDGIYILLLSLLLINTVKTLLLKKEKNISSHIKWMKIQSIILFFLYSTDYLGSLYIISFINWQIKYLFIYPYFIGIIITAINIILIQYKKEQIKDQVPVSPVEKLDIYNLKNLINKKKFSKHVSSLIRKGTGDGIGIGSLLHLLYNKEKIKIPFSLYILKKPVKRNYGALLFNLFSRKNIKAWYTFIKEKPTKAGTKAVRSIGALILLLFNRIKIKAWYTFIKEKLAKAGTKAARSIGSLILFLFNRIKIKAWYTFIKEKLAKAGTKAVRSIGSLILFLFNRIKIKAWYTFIKEKLTKAGTKTARSIGSLILFLFNRRKIKVWYTLIKKKAVGTGIKTKRGVKTIFFTLFNRKNINPLLSFIKEKITKIDTKIGSASLDFILLIKKKVKNLFLFIKIKLFRIKKFHYPLSREEEDQTQKKAGDRGASLTKKMERLK